MPKSDNEGAHGTAAFDDARGDVVREVIEDDLMGKEFSNKWWGHVVASCSKSLLILGQSRQAQQRYVDLIDKRKVFVNSHDDSGCFPISEKHIRETWRPKL